MSDLLSEAASDISASPYGGDWTGWVNIGDSWLCHLPASHLDLEHLGRLDDVRQSLLGHVHLTVVHKVDEGLQVAVPHVLQDHDRVLAWIQDEQRLKGGGVGDVSERFNGRTGVMRTSK